MLTNSKIIICLFLMVSYCNAAIATENQEQTIQLETPGYFYLGAKFGIIRYQHGCQDWAISCDKRDKAIGLYTGYQINKNFAVEFSYADLGEVEARSDEYGNVNSYRATMEGFDLGVLTQYPISNKLNVFAKIAAFKWYGKNVGPYRTLKSNEWSPTVSAGVQYQLNENWRAKLSYQIIDDLGNTKLGSSNGHIAWLGISYTFGQKPSKYRMSQAVNPVIENQVLSQPIPATNKLISISVSKPMSEKNQHGNSSALDTPNGQNKQKDSAVIMPLDSSQIENN